MYQGLNINTVEEKITTWKHYMEKIGNKNVS